MYNKIKSRNYSVGNKKVSPNIKIDIKNQISTYRNYKPKKYEKNIKPSIKPGFFSYNKTLNYIGKNSIKNSRNTKINNNSIFQSLNNNIIKHSTSEQNNYLNNIFLSSTDKNGVTKNSFFSHSTIDLNKYKINENFNIRTYDVNDNKNLNKFVNKSINLNINFNYEKNNNKENIEKNNKISHHYKNYFSQNEKYEIESRRMMLEYVKILHKKEKDIQNILTKKNFSEKILNQRYEKGQNSKNINSINTNFNDNILFGEEKKNMYLKNLNYTLSDESNSSSGEAYYEENAQDKNIIPIYNKNDIGKIPNIFSYINTIKNQKNKKINIIDYLCVPKVLNLIESNKKKEKYIFMITPDESAYIQGEENYKLVWKNIINDEIQNEINIKDIKKCYLSNKYENRFIIEVGFNKYNNLKIEIESFNHDICTYFVNGIKYIIEELEKNDNKKRYLK